MKKLFTFISSYWHIIFFSVFVILILVINIRSGFLFLTNDNYSPELNPLLVIERALYSPAIRIYRGLGLPSDSEQSDIFRGIFFLFSNSLLGLEISNQIVFLGYLIIAICGTYLFTNTIVKRYFKDIHPTHTSLIASMIYITSLWTVWVFNFPVMPYVVLYGTLPLLFWAFIELVYTRNWFRALIFLIASIIISGAFTVSTLFFVTCLGLGLLAWILLFDFRNIKSNITYAFLGVSIFILSQLFWLFPFVTYVQSNANTIQSSSVNETITNSTIDLESDKMSFSNSLRFYTRALDIYDDSTSEVKMFKNANDYNDFEVYRILSYLPLLLFCLGVVLGIYYKKYIVIPFSLLYIVSVWGVKNSNPPFGELYSYLQNNLDIFKQVFRWSSSKFSNLTLLGLAPIAGIGFSYLLKLLDLNKVRFSKVLYIIPVALLLFFGSFLFNGNLVADRTYSKIPNSYFELNEFILGNNLSTERILVLPPSNLGYFREYNWGFYGSGFLHYIIPNSMLEKSLVVGSKESEDALNQIEQAYFSSNFDLFDSLLQKYNIKTLLVDRSLVKGRYGYEIDWNLVNKYLKNYKPIYSSDGLELYSIENKNQVSNLWTNNSSFYGYNLLNIDGEKKVEGSWLTITNSELTDLSPISLEYEWNIFPINLSYNTTIGEILVRPVFPEISNFEYQVPAKSLKTKLSEKEVVKIGNYYIQGAELLKNKEINLNLKFGDISEIHVTNLNTSSDITTRFFDQKSVDCSGLKKDKNTFSEFYQNHIVLGAKDSISCISKSLNGFSGITKIEFEINNEGQNIGGLCVFDFEKNRCINSNVYTFGNNKVEVNIPFELSASTSLFIYNNSKNRENFEKSILKNVTVTESSFKKDGLNNSNISIGNKLSNKEIRIPILLDANSYYNNFSSNNTLDWSTVRDVDNLQMSTETRIVHTKLNEDYSYQFTPLLKPNNSFYYYLVTNNNLSGFPPIICIKTADSPRCTVERTFKTNTSSTLSGVFLPESNVKNLEMVLRTSSYSTESNNSLQLLSLFEIPDAWNNIKYKIENGKYLTTEVVEIRNDDPNKSIYSSKLTNLGSYVLDSAYSKYWNLYLTEKNIDNYPYIFKQFLIPIIGEKVEDGYKYNDWQQAWKISDGEDLEKNIYITYTPNTYSYVGYIILVILLSVTITLSIIQWTKKLKSQ